MYVNEVAFFRPLAPTEALPFSVTFNELSAVAVDNAIVSAVRYEYGSDYGGVSVSSLASITGNVVTLSGIWAGGETDKSRKLGRYRVELKARNAGSTIIGEINMVFLVVL